VVRRVRQDGADVRKVLRTQRTPALGQVSQIAIGRTMGSPLRTTTVVAIIPITTHARRAARI